MKKKNIIGHMSLPKEKKLSWIRRSAILPRLFCLMLAVLIWLIICGVNPSVETELPNGSVGEVSGTVE